MAAALTARQVLTRLWSVLDRIAETLDEEAADWAADRQLCLEDVQSALTALTEQIEPGIGSEQAGALNSVAGDAAVRDVMQARNITGVNARVIGSHTEVVGPVRIEGGFNVGGGQS